MPSAEERESALRPYLDAARRQVADLQAEVKGNEADAHDAYVRGDAAAGDAHHEKAAGLKPSLATASERLRTLEEAAGAVAEDRHREQLEAQLARTRQALAEALATSQQHTADIRPALALAQQKIRLAQQSEDRARSLETQIFNLEVGLGLREHARVIPLTNRVRAMLEATPYLRDLLRLDV